MGGGFWWPSGNGLAVGAVQHGRLFPDQGEGGEKSLGDVLAAFWQQSASAEANSDGRLIEMIDRENQSV